MYKFAYIEILNSTNRLKLKMITCTYQTNNIKTKPYSRKNAIKSHEHYYTQISPMEQTVFHLTSEPTPN